MLEEIGLEGVEVVPKDFAPLPPKLEPLADFAEACGGEREETRLRLGAYQYLVVAKRP
jgi:hypothetical protein